MNKSLLNQCIDEILHKTIRSMRYQLDHVRLKEVCNQCDCRATKKNIDIVISELKSRIANTNNFSISEEITGIYTINWNH